MRHPRRALVIPARKGPEPPAPPELYVEPDNDIELLGEMLHDVEIMLDKLKFLPFEREHYRADLRIVRGNSVRMAARCARLLGEAPDPEGAVERLATAIERQIRPEPSEPTAAELAEAEDIQDEVSNLQPSAAEASNKIDVGAGLPEKPAFGGYVEEEAPAANSHPTRKNGSARPKKTGEAYTVTESFIMSELKDRGTATTRELVDWVAKERRVPPVEVHDALARLRVAGKITTSRLGRGLLNRIAEGVA